MKTLKFIILTIIWHFFINQSVFSQNAAHTLETNKQALVSIWAFDYASYNYITEEYSFDTLTLWGSGFIVSDDGLVGTCYHVISDLDSILIKTYDGSFFHLMPFQLIL